MLHIISSFVAKFATLVPSHIPQPGATFIDTRPDRRIADLGQNQKMFSDFISASSQIFNFHVIFIFLVPYHHTHFCPRKGLASRNERVISGGCMREVKICTITRPWGVYSGSLQFDCSHYYLHILPHLFEAHSRLPSPIPVLPMGRWRLDRSGQVGKARTQSQSQSWKVSMLVTSKDTSYR